MTIEVDSYFLLYGHLDYGSSSITNGHSLICD